MIDTLMTIAAIFLVILVIGLPLIFTIYLIFDGEYLFAFFFGVITVFAALVLTISILQTAEGSKIQEGTVIETGYREEKCVTYYYKVGKTMVPRPSCTGGYHYIVIDDGARSKEVKVSSNSYIKVGDYYKERIDD